MKHMIIKTLKTILFLIIIIKTESAFANVTITKATGGTSISADKATNALIPAYTTIGSIKLTEGVITDFAIGTNVTVVLNAPTGWTFNTAAAITSTYTLGRDISVATVLSKTTTAITIQITVGGNTKTDVLTIAGVQVIAIDGANVTGAGNITRSGTAVIAGCTTGTNLGTLSQKAGVESRLILSLPGQTYTDAVTMAGSGNTGTITSQIAGTSFALSKITAIDQFLNVATTYAGIKTITYSGPSNGLTTPTYTTSVSFTSGKSTTALTTTLKKAETTTITVTDGIVAGIISSSLLVNPGAVSKFVVESSAGGNISNQIAGTAFNIKATAFDVENNICNAGPNVYTGTVTLSSTGILSSGGVTSALVAGVLATQSVTISNTGNFTITATRTIGGAQNGISNSFQIDPGVFNNFLIEDVSGGNIGTHIAGLSFNIKITARDANNNACTSGINVFTGTVNITSTGTLASGGGTSAAFSAGVLSPKTIIISNLGYFTITATKTSGSQAGTSNTFQVTNIAISPECVLTGGSNFTLTVNGSNFNSSCLVRIIDC